MAAAKANDAAAGFVVSTLCGTGNSGFANGKGATAQLNRPNGIAFDDQKRQLIIAGMHECVGVGVGFLALNGCVCGWFRYTQSSHSQL